MATTISKTILKVVRQLHGSSPKAMDYPELASETFVRGEIVFSAGGFLREIAGNTPAAILGVAAEDAGNAAANGGADASVYLADPDNIFEGNMLGTGGADHVLTDGDLGTAMGIQRVTADSAVYLDASVKAGANTRVWVHKAAPGSNVGDTNARVLFSFLPEFVQYLTTS